MNTTLSREKIRDLYMSKYLEKKVSTDARIAEGINKNRKGDCRVKVVDSNGNSKPYTKVKISQQTHDFKLGANIFLLDEFQTEEENAAYRANFKDIFNLATIPFYWDGLEPVEGSPRYAKNSPKVTAVLLLTSAWNTVSRAESLRSSIVYTTINSSPHGCNRSTTRRLIKNI